MLDINTPKGRICAEQQREALEILKETTGRSFLMTADDNSADIDAFSINEKGSLESVMEIKSRDMTLNQLQDFKDEWLVTFNKIISGLHFSSMLKVPFYGVLHLIPDQKVLTIKIADEHGEACVPFRVDRTQTQKTCNGGQVVRVNAYINMASAKVFQKKISPLLHA